MSWNAAGSGLGGWIVHGIFMGAKNVALNHRDYMGLWDLNVVYRI